MNTPDSVLRPLETTPEKAGRIISTMSLGALTSLLPVIGPVIHTTITEMMPDKRFERLEDGLKRLEKLLDGKVDSINLTDDQTFDVFEEGIHQFSRAFNDERRQYIAHLVADGITSENEEQLQARHFMRILNQLGDEDIAVLGKHQNRNSPQFEEGLTLSRERLLASFGLLVVSVSDLGAIGASHSEGAKEAFRITKVGSQFLEKLELGRQKQRIA